jgi:hypothetical protein
MSHRVRSHRQTGVMQADATTTDEDLFTPVFKHFRRLSEADCFRQSYSVVTHPEQFEFCSSFVPFEIDRSLGLRETNDWSLYACRFAPGLYLLRNTLTDHGQKLWIERCVRNYARQMKTSVGDNRDNQQLARLRWVTLGYHYDWTEKIYKRDDHSAIPDQLAQLCRTVMTFIASATGTIEYGSHSLT